MDFLAHARTRFRTCGLLALVAILAALSLKLAASASATTFAPQATLTANDEIGKSLLGSAVALSHDGDTALIGGPQDNNGIGAVWVFTRRGSTWTEQAKLTGVGEVGSGEFGTGVALSADGKTALIGGPGDNGGLGVAWVFTRRGSTWTQRGSKLTGGGEIGEGRFGSSVALSSDGKTALIGGPGDTERDGAAWVFTRKGSTWTQQGSKLIGGGEVNKEPSYEGTYLQVGGLFGAAVALSSDGDTALIGGPHDDYRYYVGQVGAVWVFTRKGLTWAQQGSKLTGEEPTTATRRPYTLGAPDGELGAGVALSAGGNTALAGVRPRLDACLPGEALVFTRSGSTWTQKSEPLEGTRTCPGEEGRLGYRVALSSDANTTLIGGERSGWVFTRSGSTWSQQIPPLICGGDAYQCGVALSGDARTALVGTAVYVPAEVPVIRSVTPNDGWERGGTGVTVTGSRFTHATAVKFGFTSATSFMVNSDSSVTAISPAGQGAVDVTVSTTKGTSVIWSGDRFSYVQETRPTVRTGPALEVRRTSAVLLGGALTPEPTGPERNRLSISDCHFEYGTTTSYGSSVPCVGSALGLYLNSTWAWAYELSPSTIYHFRIVATNPIGTSYGADETFKTLP